MTEKEIKIYDSIIAEYELRKKYNYDQRDYEAYSVLVKAREYLIDKLKENNNEQTIKL